MVLRCSGPLWLGCPLLPHHRQTSTPTHERATSKVHAGLPVQWHAREPPRTLRLVLSLDALTLASLGAPTCVGLSYLTRLVRGAMVCGAPRVRQEQRLPPNLHQRHWRHPRPTQGSKRSVNTNPRGRLWQAWQNQGRLGLTDHAEGYSEAGCL